MLSKSQAAGRCHHSSAGNQFRPRSSIVTPALFIRESPRYRPNCCRSRRAMGASPLKSKPSERSEEAEVKKARATESSRLPPLGRKTGAEGQEGLLSPWRERSVADCRSGKSPIKVRKNPAQCRLVVSGVPLDRREPPPLKANRKLHRRCLQDSFSRAPCGVPAAGHVMNNLRSGPFAAVTDYFDIRPERVVARL